MQLNITKSYLKVQNKKFVQRTIALTFRVKLLQRAVSIQLQLWKKAVDLL